MTRKLEICNFSPTIPMQLHTFKARSLADAMRLVRDELGPDASVLHTREIGSPLARLICGRMIEVTASPEPCAPSRLPEISGSGATLATPAQRSQVPAAELQNFRRRFRHDLLAERLSGASLVEKLAQRTFSRSSASSS
jgi:flagellar biosynthesis GTPase FlhF